MTVGHKWRIRQSDLAVEILKRCDGKASVAAIADDLSQTFSTDRDQVASDVTALLQDLADKGMLDV